MFLYMFNLWRQEILIRRQARESWLVVLSLCHISSRPSNPWIAVKMQDCVSDFVDVQTYRAFLESHSRVSLENSAKSNSCLHFDLYDLCPDGWLERFDENQDVRKILAGLLAKLLGCFLDHWCRE